MVDPLADLNQLRIDRSSPPPARPWVKLLVGFGLVGALGAGVVYGSRALSGSLAKPVVEVTEVGWISPAQASVNLTSTGYVVPQRVAKVGAKVTGRVTRTLVREAQEVKAGETLFELDPTDQKSAIASAQARVLAAGARAQTARANLADIKQQYERQKKLAASGSVAQATVDDLAARVDASEAQVKAADAETAAAQAEVNALSITLGSFKIVAPIDGVAVSKPAEIGDVVAPLAVLVELVDFSSLLVETDVPEGRIGVVQKGGPAELVFDAYPEKRWRGEVVGFGPRMNRAKATGLVKVKVLEDSSGDAGPSTPPIRPEMAARVSFLAKALDPNELKEPPKLVIPDAAVTDRAGAKVAFVIQGDRVHAVTLTLGEPMAGGFVVKDGLRAGDRLVKNPPASLNDGQSIKEKNG